MSETTKHLYFGGHIQFPAYSGIRCLMMPYVQGEPDSIPDVYAPYRPIVASVVAQRGEVGYLTIDESVALRGTPHRGARAVTNRALHTEAGRLPDAIYCWGSGGGSWGGKRNVTLDRDVQVLLANNVDGSCALWDAEHEHTSADGDIGYEASRYPYTDAVLMRAGDLYRIGIFTPHESLPVTRTMQRQFLRIVSSGVHGREPYFTNNPLMEEQP